MMEKNTLISRKTFFQILAGLILTLLAWIWQRLSSHQIELENRQEFRHGKDLPLGISYFDKYYLFKNESTVQAFLTTCTHAGCRIGQSAGTTLQCSCHGSQFDAATGKPLRGPAIKPLTELDCRFDDKTEQWVVRIKTT